MLCVKVITSDGKVFEVDIEILKYCLTITQLLTLVEPKEQAPIPLCNVDAATFEKVLIWLKHHHKYYRHAERNSEKKNCVLSTWDTNFFKIDVSELSKVIKAADYLQISRLFTVGCKDVANKMKKAKTPEKVCQLFGWELLDSASLYT